MNSIKIDRRFFSTSLNTAADQLEGKALEALNNLRSKTCIGREWTGWFNWPEERGVNLVKDIHDWKSKINENFDLIVVIGIGGSYLGAKALADLAGGSFSPGFASQSDRAAARIPIVFAGQNMSERSLGDLLELMDTRSPIV